jgi:hypothetical protein
MRNIVGTILFVRSIIDFVLHNLSFKMYCCYYYVTVNCNYHVLSPLYTVLHLDYCLPFNKIWQILHMLQFNKIILYSPGYHVPPTLKTGYLLLVLTSSLPFVTFSCSWQCVFHAIETKRYNWFAFILKG